MPDNKYSIIGLTGTFGSGKSAAADFFEQKGFTKVVLSSFLEEEAKRRRIRKITRKLLQNIGNQWRKEYGKEILAKKAINFLREKNIKKAVIDGIRNTGEIEELKKYTNFILIAIIADRKIRLERLKKLKRRENLTSSLFDKLDKRDSGLGQKKTGLQVTQCIGLADVSVYNNSSSNDFTAKLNSFLKSFN